MGDERGAAQAEVKREVQVPDPGGAEGPDWRA